MFPELPAESAVQGGAFTYDQAVAAGWTPWQIEAAARSGHLVPVVQGVFVLPERTEGLSEVQQHLLAVRGRQLAAEPGWHAGRRSSALLHDLPIIGRPPQEPQLVRDPEGTKAKGHSRNHRIAPLPLEHRELVDGMPTCNRARTVVDIARAESFRNG